MLTETTSITKHDSLSSITKKHDHYTKPSSTSSGIFVLCDSCYWCATYVDKNRIQGENRCPQCNANNNELTSLPVMPNESFAFDYNDKRGIELEFKLR
jgi:hypothetical protein